MKRFATVLLTIAMVVLLGSASLSWAGGTPPSKWEISLVDNGTLSTFPTVYIIEPAGAHIIPYQIKYTYGGTGTVTMTEECSIDGTNFIVQETPISASSSSEDFINVFTFTDGASAEHPISVCMVHRLNFTAAGGSPSLTAVYVTYIRRH